MSCTRVAYFFVQSNRCLSTWLFWPGERLLGIRVWIFGGLHFVWRLDAFRFWRQLFLQFNLIPVTPWKRPGQRITTHAAVISEHWQLPKSKRVSEMLNFKAWLSCPWRPFRNIYIYIDCLQCMPVESWRSNWSL